MNVFRLRYITLPLLSVLTAVQLHAESIDDALDGFDDTATPTVEKTTTQKADDEALAGFDDTDETEAAEQTGSMEEDAAISDSGTEESSGAGEEEMPGWLPDGLTGKLTQQLLLAYNSTKPENMLSSLRTTLFLDYEHRFDNGVKVKLNARSFYDGIYDVRAQDYTVQERQSLRSEAELYDAYVEWNINDSLSLKAGRQVVVWGRSDTIRITDVLNPLDFRRPGIVDIEDLRLPVGMLRFDYSIGNWRITPIAILEQRFTKNPPYGSAFNPLPYLPQTGQVIPFPPTQASYHDVTYAVSAGAEYHGWDINLYAAHIYDDHGYIINAKPFVTPTQLHHDKSTMFGTALNLLSGSWLFKTEAAYWRDLRYTYTPEKKMQRIDGLIGVEYTGIADTMISYDIAVRHFIAYDQRLMQENLEENTYQHAFRISTSFFNDTLHVNYLHTRFGLGLDHGGFHRGWVVDDISDAFSAELGFVDYFGGSASFDQVKDEALVFMNFSYSF